MAQLDGLLIWGSGSQALLYHRLARSFDETAIVVDPAADAPPAWIEPGDVFFGVGDELGYALKQCRRYIVAVGGEHGKARVEISHALQRAGLSPAQLLDPSCDIKPSVELGPGAYIAQRVTINHECRIGRDAILNTACSIDHEARIGEGVHIMGAAAIAGRVTIEDYAVIGTNATILPDVKIGRGAFIGAGAVVVADAPATSIIIGVPGRTVKRRTLRSDASSVRAIEKASQTGA